MTDKKDTTMEGIGNTMACAACHEENEACPIRTERQ